METSSYNSVIFNRDVLSLFKTICQKRASEENAFHLDSTSFYNILRLAYNAMGDRKKQNLDKNTKLKYILESAPRAPKYKSGIFTRSDHKINENFQKVIGYDGYVDNLPRDEKQKNQINTNITKMFPDITSDFLPFLPPIHTSLYIKDESHFTGAWQYPFYSDQTDIGNFYYDNNKRQRLNMMWGENIYGYRYQCPETKDTVAMLKYVENYAMMIYLPHSTQNKEQLLAYFQENVDAEKIQIFLCKMELFKFGNVTMPKFKMNSQWQLTSHDECNLPYVYQILDHNNVDFTNISSSLNTAEGIVLQSSSEIDNNERGTKVKTRTSMMMVDGIDKTALNLNRPFIYMILDENNRINILGYFAGTEINVKQ